MDQCYNHSYILNVMIFVINPTFLWFYLHRQISLLLSSTAPDSSSRRITTHIWRPIRRRATTRRVRWWGANGANLATCDLIHREGTVTTNFCYSSYMDSKIKEIIYSMSIYIYMVPSSVSPPPQWVGSPGSSPNSLPFASYWQHFWGPASYLLGLCSISDYQPRIY
jgi:hypothetical protein